MLGVHISGVRKRIGSLSGRERVQVAFVTILSSAVVIFLGVQLFLPSVIKVECFEQEAGQWQTIDHPFEFCYDGKDILGRAYVRRPTFFMGAPRLRSHGKLILVEADSIDGYRETLTVSPELFGDKDVISTVYETTHQRLFLVVKPSAAHVAVALIFFVIINGLILWVLHDKRTKWATATALSLTLGTGLRLAYVFSTSFAEREHDVYGHLEYVGYILKNWSLPSSHIGWQTYHPPLYYAFTAVMATLQNTVASVNAIDVQLWSLFASIVVLYLGYRIAVLAFKDDDRTSIAAFTAVLACLPGLIYFAPRINNDVFAQLSQFAALLFLTRWWNTRNIRDWYVAIIITAVGCLTKSNAAVTLFIALAMAAARSSLDMRSKIKLAFSAVLICVATVGWFHYQRFVDEGQRYVVGNITEESLEQSRLDVEYDIGHLLSFNAIRMVSVPYAEPRGELRSYFLEYMFKSTFFGQYVMEQHSRCSACALWTSRTIMATAMALLLVAIYGLYMALRQDRQRTLPMWMSLAVILALYAYMRLSPLASSTTQDFRYMSLIAVPVTYFTVYGIRKLPKFRGAAWTIFAILLIACTASIINIVMTV